MISFKHKVFLEVARNLSFTKAAAALFISQPAVTRHIKQLEDAYQVNLFERKGGKIALTEQGSTLISALQKAKEIERQLTHDFGIQQNAKSTKGELKLGASTTVALYIAPPVLAAFRKKFPMVRISLFNRNSEGVLDALLNHEIDLGIIEGKKKMAQVHSSHFLSDEVIPVCAPHSPIVSLKRITPKNIVDLPIALRERGSGTLEAIKNALQEHGIKISDFKNIIRLGGTEALKNFLLADECLGFLPHRSVLKELRDGSLVRVNIEKLAITRQFYFIQRHGEEGLNLSTSFIQLAKNHYNIKL